MPPDRRKFIGGSDAAAIMGLGAYGQTAYKVWLAKTAKGPVELDPKQKKFLDRRKRFEPQIVAMLREEFAAEIVTVNQRHVDPYHEFLAAEIDFEWRDSTGEVQNGEIKTVHPLAYGEQHGWGEEGSDEIPINYAAQVMHGMGVTGRATCVVAAMIGIDDMIFYRVQRDEEILKAMREQCVRFWLEHVLANVPPAPQDWSDMMMQLAKVKGRPVECTKEILDALRDLHRVRSSEKALKLEEEELRFKIADFVREQWGGPLAMIDDFNKLDDAELRFNGQAIATWKKQRGTHLDQQGLAQAYPDITARFTKEHWFRPIRFKQLPL
jgi:putative phage-type endonuclease